MKKPEFIARQSRRPTGLLGAIVARIMARETRPENLHALRLLDLVDGDSLIDVGCGHGETLFEADSMVQLSGSAGVDFSEAMLSRARTRNLEAVRDMRLTLRCADTVALPFPDQHFSKALSVHTIYFWSDPAAHLAEAFRVLRAGGRFVLCYRSTEDSRAVSEYPNTVYRFPQVCEVEMMLSQIGFSRLETRSEDISGRLTHWSIAMKPKAKDCKAG